MGTHTEILIFGAKAGIRKQRNDAINISTDVLLYTENNNFCNVPSKVLIEHLPQRYFCS